MQMELAQQFFLINLPLEAVNPPRPSPHWALLQVERDRSSAFAASICDAPGNQNLQNPPLGEWGATQARARQSEVGSFLSGKAAY